MIVYNVTVNIDNDIQNDWVHWMKEQHIPDVFRTGHFIEHKMMELKDPAPEEGSTFSIQYICKSEENLQKYFSTEAEALQKEHGDRYANKFVAFRTILELV